MKKTYLFPAVSLAEQRLLFQTLGAPSERPSGDPRTMSYEVGSLERHNMGLLTVQLKEAIRTNQIKTSDVAQWLTQPWTMWEFIQPRSYSATDVANAAPNELEAWQQMLLTMLSGDARKTLEEWHSAAAQGPDVRDQWERANVARKTQLEAIVRRIHDSLVENLQVFEETNKKLNAVKGTNWIEGVLRGTKEYIVDDFSSHPEMSAGLVAVTFLAYNMVKGTKLWDIAKWGAAVTIGGAFFKDKFGIQPTEALAKGMERIGLQSGADGFRKLRDTLLRGANGPEDAKTINGYYYQELKLNSDEQRFAFDAMLRQKPKELIPWYDAANRWLLSGKASDDRVPPPEVSGYLRRMETSHEWPTYFQNLSDLKKVQLLRDTVGTVFMHIAERNGTVPGSPDQGLVVVKGKYVDGQYFNVLWDKAHAFNMYLDEYYGSDSALKAQIDKIFGSANEFYDAMGKHVQAGSDLIDMEMILYLEAGDPKKFNKFAGPGYTGGEILSFLQGKKDELVRMAGDVGGRAWEDIEAFFGTTVPVYWENAWTNTIKPFLVNEVKPMAEADWRAIQDWFNNQVMPRARSARDLGMTHVLIPAGRLGLTIWNNAKGAIEMTMDQVEKLRVWLEEEAAMREAARTFDAHKDGAGNTVCKVDRVIPGCKYVIKRRLVAEKDPAAPAGTPDPPAPLDEPARDLCPADAGPLTTDTKYPLPPPAGYPPAGSHLRRAEIILEIQNAPNTHSVRSSTKTIAY